MTNTDTKMNTPKGSERPGTDESAAWRRTLSGRRSPRLFTYFLAVMLTMTMVVRGHDDHDPAAATTQNEGELEAEERIKELLQAIDAGKPTKPLVFDAAKLGMTALWIAVDKMNLDRLPHRRPFILLAARVAVIRKSNRELLRLYNPPAYRAFYLPAGDTVQAAVAQALTWKETPPHTATALVLAAPKPTLAWLNAQSKGPLKQPELLLEILRVWGTEVSIKHEHQYVKHLRDVAERLAGNAAVTRNDDLLLGLLQFISDVASLSVIDRVIAWLNHPAPDIRAAAANTLSRLGGDAALQALLKRIRKEPVAETQKHIAEALARWPDDPKAGAACLQLFNRTNVPDVRRAVLVSAGNSNWPQRSGLIRRAMQMQGAVVVGVNAKPVPGLEDVLLGILKKSAGKHLKPALIDALATARIAAATPALVQMLAREKNVGMRLKLIFALERIGGNAARDALGELLSSAKDELEIEYLINAVGHVKCVAALPYLARLAKDRSAPLSARAQALWGLGCMPDPRARAELEAIRKNFTKHFGQFSDRAVNHDTEYHMLIVKPQLLLALYRTGSTTAEREIHRLYRESGPMGQTVLLSGIKEQKADHPIIADGLKSNEFAVLYFAIAAARATGSRTYVPRLRQLAGSPFLRSISGLGNESWGLYDLLLNDLLKEAL